MIEPVNQGQTTVGSDAEAILENCLQRLASMGPVSAPRALRELLDAIHPELHSFVLLELIKLDMALHAEAGRRPVLEDYLRSFSDLIDEDAIPVDLVLEEIQLRKEAGLEPDPAEYQRRFPQFASIINHLLHGTELTSSHGRLRKPTELALGAEFDDFSIIHKLGEGAFAQVFLARQISMQRLVALKVATRTGDEPQALAQFDHPNIVRVFDQRIVREPEVHLLYMQYHPGGTLADVVAILRENGNEPRDGRLLLRAIDQNLLRAAQVVPELSSIRHWLQSAEWPVVVAWIGVQLASALKEAHRMGILHRDVKPANVLLTAEGIPKLADFNVSFAGASGRAGAAASFGGSIGYMAPEHLLAISNPYDQVHPEVSHRADLYSLAVLLWELWQGNRPFSCDRVPSSWSSAVAQQLESRRNPLIEPKRRGSPSERVLERTLRFALEYETEKRPKDAAEMAGRLKLALHPEAADLFDPASHSLRSWLADRSPWLTIGAVVLIPNIVAGFLNYEYNIREIEMTDVMRESLANLAVWVNSFLYPLGVILMVYFTKGLVGAMEGTRAGRPITSEEIDDTLGLGHRAALIGGTCWIGAGIVYTVILTSMYEAFTSIQATHFFISMVICGGVAMVYPMFGMALLITYVYYPILVRSAMRDDHFDQHHARMLGRCESYLLVAILIPMLGTALLISSESNSRGFMLTTIAAGVFGLLASFFAYRLIAQTWSRFAEVLATRSTVVKE